MDRRTFLISTGAACALAVQPALGQAALTQADSSRLLRYSPERQRFLPLSTAATEFAPAVAATTRKVVLRGLFAAPGSSLAALQLDAVFAAGADALAPRRHLAWHYRRDDAFGSSRASSFELAAENFLGLELRASTDSAVLPATLCSLRDRSGHALPDGRYLLLPAAESTNEGLAFSGDWQQPLASETGIDALLLELATEHAAPDLALREDLACLAAAQADADSALA